MNIASQAGIVVIEERAAYGASKAGFTHLTKSLALEWASHGIRMNAVAPTFVRTELTESTPSGSDWQPNYSVASRSGDSASPTIWEAR